MPKNQTSQVKALTAENARLKFYAEQRMNENRFSPEVEKRREDYERQAEAIAVMIEHEQQRAAGGLLDISQDALDARGEECEPYIGNAISKHLFALFYSLDNLYDPRTVRRFYAELRLWADELELQRKEQVEETAA
jgi:hypothetical protein